MQNDDRTSSEKSGVPNEKKFVWLICLLAAVHVFIFSAAFPFFNIVDEPAHFDLVIKYADGQVGMEKFSPASIPYLVFFSAYDFFSAPDAYPGGKIPPPLWTASPEVIKETLVINGNYWRARGNYERSQTPLYYTFAAVWWRIGGWLGFVNGRLLYWLRFLNIVFVVALVLVGYLAARLVFPGNLFIRLAVPALVALMPQTAFYSIGNDILSPLSFGVTFIALLKWCEKTSVPAGALLGLAFAATYLSKTTNEPLLAIVAAVVLLKAWQDLWEKKSAGLLPSLAAFVACAAVPLGCWMIWCQSHFGDLTGWKSKMAFFGWTVKPFGDWWHHPIFTPVGAWTYLSGQLGTFWQGEFSWHNQPLALPGSRAAYTILSLALIIPVLPALLPGSSSASPSQRHALLISLLCFAAGVGFFGLLSIVYDFHDSPNPSRAHPYFQAGRMFLGVLIPFLIIIVYGLDRLLNRFGTKTKFLVLGMMILIMLISEIAADWPVFSNPYNWFHLP